jgi:hypothetical protein
MEVTDEQILLEKKARLLALAGLWAEHEDKVDLAQYLRNLRRPKQLDLSCEPTQS